MENLTEMLPSVSTFQYWWLLPTTAYNCSTPFALPVQIKDPYFALEIIYGLLALVIIFIGVRFYLVTSSLLHAMVVSIVISMCVYCHLNSQKWIYQTLIVVSCTLVATTLISISRLVSRVFISFYFGSIVGIMIVVLIRYFTIFPKLFIAPIIIESCAIIITIPLSMIQECMFGLPVAGVASTLFVAMLDYIVGQRALSRIVLFILTSLEHVTVVPCWQHWALASLWIVLTLLGTFVQYLLVMRSMKLEFDE